MSERRDHAQENIGQLAFPNEEVMGEGSKALTMTMTP